MAIKRGVAVVALGGNAIIRRGQKGTFEEQIANVNATSKQVLEVIKRGWNVILTHGNGPQVGNILIQQEMAKDVIPRLPMDVCGARTQGEIGYLIQQTLTNKLVQAGIEKSVVTVVTQVIVDRQDRAFSKPTKPVGPFYTKGEAAKLRNRYAMVEDAGRKGWRRVVPSPDPGEIVEKDAIKKLMDAGNIVIACGGGGIPVVKSGKKLMGFEAVIDKDLAAERLATGVKADALIMLTDVKSVYLNYGKENQKKIDKMDLEQAKRYMEEGHFPPGSMGPKITAGIRFIENGGKKVIITSPELCLKGLEGKAGTTITKGG
jgi:carbamate kinase